MTTSTEIAKAEKSAAEMREEERRKRSNIDRLLLQNARLSPNEIAEKTGLPVDRAMSRLHDLLRSRDHLSDRMEERLLIIEMGDLIDDMKARMQAAGDQFYGDIAAVTLRGYEAIGKRLEQRRRMNELDLAEITQAQGEMILAIFAETLHDQAEYLEELHPDSEWDIYDGIEAAFAYALPLAQERINKRVRE
jgi:hypothetical protein